jgi:hypothetical protein
MLADYFLRPGPEPTTGRVLCRRRLVAGAVLTLAFLVVAARAPHRPQNLARGKTATSSSQGFGTRPSGVIDGFRYGQLGFHSTEEHGAWLMIDLGANYELSQIVAFGRADCCFSQSVPLELELSKDGKAFRRIATRTTPFSQFEPWTAELQAGDVFRFVRFKTRKRAFLVLSEVEVYGRYHERGR